MGWLDSETAAGNTRRFPGAEPEPEELEDWDDEDDEITHTWTTILAVETPMDDDGWVAVIWRFGVLGSSPELVREMFFGEPCRIRRFGWLYFGRPN